MDTQKNKLLQDYIRMQDLMLSDVLFEITIEGYKSSHWSWYFFPNLPGLGTSELSRHYAIDLPTYIEFLTESERFRRNIFTVMVAIDKAYRNSLHMDIEYLLGNNSVDVLKWKSFLTLTWFAYLNADSVEGWGGQPVIDTIRYGQDIYGTCPFTVEKCKGYSNNNKRID